MNLTELISALPSDPQTLEDKARAILRLLSDWESMDPRKFRVESCPNCGGSVADGKRPYCSDFCREQAALIRQMRRALAEGSLESTERQIAVAATMWHLLGGGYPLRVAMIPPGTVRKVIEKSGGNCETCGAKATTVDHIRTACNRPINLRAVCADCTKVRMFEDSEFLALEKTQSVLSEVRNRVAALQPVQECDDPVVWDWRDFLRRRKAAALPL